MSGSAGCSCYIDDVLASKIQNGALASVILLGENGQVPKKKKDVFDVAKAVKAAARERVGTPPPTKEIPDAISRQKRRAEKHKTTLGKLLSEQ